MIRIDRIATTAFLVLMLGGCASGPRLVASAPALPKAKGTIIYKKTEHGTRIFLKVMNLAEPEELNPPGYAYVAWVQSDREGSPYNVGALIVDDGLKGELRTTTPLRDFEFFVTAEASRDVPEPTGPPLLWTHRDDAISLARHDERSQLASIENR